MNNISCIKYTEPFFSENLDGQKTQIKICELFGYVKKIDNAIIVRFAKGVSTAERNDLVSGMIIPRSCLISHHGAVKNEGIVIQTNVTAEWEKPYFTDNDANPQITHEKITGVLEREGSDYLVIRNKNEDKIIFWTIPKSVIIKIYAE